MSSSSLFSGKSHDHPNISGKQNIHNGELPPTKIKQNQQQ
jgi:hypothetical protein